MKTWQKIVVVCVSGAAVWGLAFAGTVWTQYAMVFASFASGVSAMCGILTGFTGSK